MDTHIGKTMRGCREEVAVCKGDRVYSPDIQPPEL